MKRVTRAFALLLAVILFSARAYGEETLKEFTFTVIDGKTIPSSQFEGKPLVIIMLASWCPPCKKEAPDLEKAYRAYKDKGVFFLGVFVASSKGSIRKFAEKYELTFPVGTGEGISEQFGWKPFPAAAFVSPDGVIRQKHVGQSSYEELVRGIEEILK